MGNNSEILNGSNIQSHYKQPEIKSTNHNSEFMYSCRIKKLKKKKPMMYIKSETPQMQKICKPSGQHTHTRPTIDSVPVVRHNLTPRIHDKRLQINFNVLILISGNQIFPANYLLHSTCATFAAKSNKNQVI